MIYEIVLIVLCVVVLKLIIALLLYLKLPTKKKKQLPAEKIIPEQPEDHLLAFRSLFSNERGETI